MYIIVKMVKMLRYSQTGLKIKIGQNDYLKNYNTELSSQLLPLFSFPSFHWNIVEMNFSSPYWNIYSHSKNYSIFYNLSISCLYGTLIMILNFDSWNTSIPSFISNILFFTYSMRYTTIFRNIVQVWLMFTLNMILNFGS